MSEKTELLRNLSFIHDIKLSVLYANELIRLSEAENNYTYPSRLSSKGNAYRLLGDLNKALFCNDAAKLFLTRISICQLMYIPLLGPTMPVFIMKRIDYVEPTTISLRRY
jgi:hypothetical protein